MDFVNRHYLVLTGRQPEQLLGSRWQDALHPEDLPGALHAFRVALERRERLEWTGRLRCADGTHRWTTTVAVPRLTPEGGLEGFVGIIVDIHAHHTAEEALRQADRRKDEFLAMLGHELRNPLVPISNAVGILERIPDDNPRLIWVRETLARQIRHLTRLVDDLMDVSRISRGVIHLHREPVDLAVVVRRAAEGVADRLRQRRQRLELVPLAEPLWVDGDVVRLVQMVDNLLTNAIKYTQDGGHIRLVVERGADGMALVRVIDDGMGIAPETLPHVFDLFVQEARALDRSQGGLGIGLALVRQLAELHGGRIEAFSAGTGRGTEFVLSLPVMDRGPAQDSTPAMQAGGGGRRVLIVDDDPDAAESTAMLLGLQGFEARTAGGCRGALAVAREFHPDVVLMDIGLPGEDGYEVARRLRLLDETGRLVIVAVSGFGQPADLERSRQAGFAAHLVKPVDPRELCEVIEAGGQRSEGRG